MTIWSRCPHLLAFFWTPTRRTSKHCMQHCRASLAHPSKPSHSSHTSAPNAQSYLDELPGRVYTETALILGTNFPYFICGRNIDFLFEEYLLKWRCMCRCHQRSEGVGCPRTSGWGNLSLLMWVLGNRLGFSERERERSKCFNCWASSPAPKLLFLKQIVHEVEAGYSKLRMAFEGCDCSLHTDT